MKSSELKTLKEMASQSGRPERRIRNLLAEGEFKHVRIGSHFFLPVDAIDEFLERKMFRPCEEHPPSKSHD